MNLSRVHAYIDEHLSEHVARIQEFVRQPSISADGFGIEECAALLADYYRRLGCQEVEVVETPEVPGAGPGVWAYYHAGAPRTIVSYAMYDVGPVYDEEQWRVPPFSGELMEVAPYRNVLVGRGAWSAKGPYSAWLNALESIIAVEGRLPFNVMFLAEGDEWEGSRNYRRLFDRFKDRLATAEAVIDPMASQNASGDIVMSLGYKGMIILDLVASGAGWERGPAKTPVHGGLMSIVGNPAWRLVHALAVLTDDSTGEPSIPELREQMAPDAEVEAMLQGLLEYFGDPRIGRKIPGVPSAAGLKRFVTDVDGLDLVGRYLFAPSFNIGGLWSGYLGPGTRTLAFNVPVLAAARMDLRVTSERSPAELVDAIRRRLDERGYPDVRLDVFSAFPSARTSPRADVVQAALRVVKAHGKQAVVWPFQASGGPWSLFIRELEMPVLRRCSLGTGGFDGAHEYFVIEGNELVGGLADCEKFDVDLLASYAAYPEPY